MKHTGRTWLSFEFFTQGRMLGAPKELFDAIDSGARFRITAVEVEQDCNRIEPVKPALTLVKG